ncbi:MAG: glycerophosphodiester phosphodiesterase [Clostridia bacterium]|nr:glycerophosphodiester phosphodiesterase [Clostridia bacterium]
MLKIWGHRGASAYAPENTLAAFRLAKEMGADGVECDAQFTKDRQVVILHDSDTLRTAGKSGLLRDLTLQELNRLDFSCGMPAYRGEKIPTLEELLLLAREIELEVNIELKTNLDQPCGLEEAICEIVSRCGMERRVIYSGNNHVSLVHMKKINPEAECNLGFYQPIYRQADYTRMLGCDGIHPDYRYAYIPGYIEECRSAGLKCRVWAPDEPQDIEAMMRMGLDVLTNKPDVAARVRKSLLKAGAIS